MQDNILSIVGFSVLGLILTYFIVVKLFGFTIIKSDEVGIVEKWWSPKQSKGGFIQLDGEAGYQPDLLYPGVHFKPIFMYKVYRKKLVTIPPNEIGYVIARDGQPIPSGRINGKIVECNSFQNARDFLKNGGQKGQQLGILMPGTYAINLALFVVITKSNLYTIEIGNEKEKTEIEGIMRNLLNVHGFDFLTLTDASQQAVVTVHEGLALPTGEIIAPIFGNDPANIETYHDSFQKPEVFLKTGGKKGKQEQVLTEGVYVINRFFASVEITGKTIIPIGWVGVVNSYCGEVGEDLSGTEYSHGTLVAKGKKGVWKDVLESGKHAFNEQAGHIEKVPTTNFMLKWETGCNGGQFDGELREISLVTKDALDIRLPLAVVLHIDYRLAPYIIQRFGDIKTLVKQTLDPMVESYFKNVAQNKTYIELLQERTVLQESAKKELKERFEEFNIGLEDVLIGTPVSKDPKAIEMLSQLSARQLSKEQVETYTSQMTANEKKRELNEVAAKADQQTALTNSKIAIEVKTNEGSALAAEALKQKEITITNAEAERQEAIYKAEGEARKIEITAEANLVQARKDAEKIELLAKAEADKTILLGDAEAKKTKAIGEAEANVLHAKISAYDNPALYVQEQVANEFTKAISTGKIPLVPQNYVGGSNTDGSSANGADVFNQYIKMKVLEDSKNMNTKTENDIKKVDELKDDEVIKVTD